MKLPASSTLLIGPPGSGKSHTIWTALRALGRGAVLMVPGSDEQGSYVDLLEDPAYRFIGVDGAAEEGFNQAEKGLRKIVEEVEADAKEGKPPRYAVLGVDKGGEMGRFVYASALAKFGIDTAPPAISPDGAAFYGYMRTQTEKLFRPLRRIKAAGVHLIFTANPKEVDKVSEASVTNDLAGGKKLMMDWPGGSRDAIPGFFDLVFHVMIKVKEVEAEGGKKKAERKHYLAWRPDPRRPTKSRFGDLGPGLLANDWREIERRALEAVERKVAQFTEGK